MARQAGAIGGACGASPRRFHMVCICFLGTMLVFQVYILVPLVLHFIALHRPPPGAALPERSFPVPKLRTVDLQSATPGFFSAPASAAKAVPSASAPLAPLSRAPGGRGLALGAAFGQGSDATLIYLTSLLRVSQNCDIVLFADVQPPAEFFKQLGSDPSRVRFEVPPGGVLPAPWQSFHPSNSRYWLYVDYLQRTRAVEKYTYIQLSDVRDVAFQADPFAWVASQSPGVHGFSEEPSIKVGTETWNKKWVLDCYGQAVLNAIGGNGVICSGYTIGTAAEMFKYAQREVDEMLAHVNCQSNGIDQGIHNVIFHGAPNAGVQGLGSQVNVVVHDNRNGPVWTGGYVPKGSLKLDSANVVMNGDNKPYAVLHQYDRHENLWQILSNKFLAEKRKQLGSANLGCKQFDIAAGDIGGFDLAHQPSDSQQECCVSCLSDSACGEFVFSAPRKHCWLKKYGAQRGNGNDPATVVGMRLPAG